MNMDIGGTIKKLRTDRNVTQEEVAEYLDISFQAVSKWETGTTMPDITLMPKLRTFSASGSTICFLSIMRMSCSAVGFYFPNSQSDRFLI